MAQKVPCGRWKKSHKDHIMGTKAITAARKDKNVRCTITPIATDRQIPNAPSQNITS